MPAVFVHGNPETDAIWRPLVAELERDDVVRLSPPGFGAPVPDGWTGDMDAYRDWLIAELEGIDGDIDLVGHDWGGGHVVNAMIHRPELVRSWCADVLALYHDDYVWHDLAQVWQTEGAGEEAVAAMVEADLDDRVGLFVSLGITEDVARDMVPAMDETMGRCILSLYRSGTKDALMERAAHLGRAAARPGLAITAGNDPYLGDPRLAEQVAARAGAGVAKLEGAGHWWMTEIPAQGARVLEAFWASV